MSDETRRGALDRLRRSRGWTRLLSTLGWIDQPDGSERPLHRSPAALGPIEILAAKVIYNHARNRQQLLGPPPTVLGHLDDAGTELLIGAAILAARASGPFDEAAERRVRGVLSAAGLQSTDPGFLGRALDRPASLDEVLHQVRDAHMVSLIYGASLLGADRHDEAGQSWLRYLAVRLKIPADTLARLHSQFGAAG